ncbi:hypothetical protein ILUMI_14486 [Ignelater luminosus]|uniref:Uncharacterized protein n=1 Tax=Ignelater luminosus TaxID=2038154 RepID=A0A8K0G7Q5_IGNLU|nr:hypothetical protein ILUMI_14789 [Ignelater luminosus]KAF2891687.1 hypothetical protein ILUMI_14486 [Ignelater luminosus]
MLQNNLRQLCNNPVEKRCDLLRHYVKHHIAVLDLSHQIAVALNELMLVHAVLMALILTVNGFQILRSVEVAESAYSIPWYDESLEFQNMVLFIILRAHKPLVLRSASISELSFPSFTKVMSSTYSYLTLLYNMILETEEL